MKELKFKQSRTKRFLKGKGFYIAIALTLIGAGIAVWLTTSNSIDKILDNGNQQISGNTKSGVDKDWGYPSANQVGDIVSGVQITSSRSSQSSAPSSSSAQSSKLSNASSASTSSTVQQQALFILPVNGEVLVPYSDGKPVLSKTMGDWRLHTGVDLKADKGTSIKAVSNGTVTKVYKDPMWGNVVEIEHPLNITTIYCSLSDVVVVKKGQAVEVGQVIGTVGNTAQIEISEESHLHFAVKKDGKYVNPLVAIGKAQ